MGVSENRSAQEKKMRHSQVANKKKNSTWPEDSKSNAKQLFSSPSWVGWECHPHLPSQPSEAFSLPKLPAQQQLQLEALETPWPHAKLKLPTWAWSKNLTNHWWVIYEIVGDTLTKSSWVGGCKIRRWWGVQTWCSVNALSLIGPPRNFLTQTIVDFVVIQPPSNKNLSKPTLAYNESRFFWTSLVRCRLCSALLGFCCQAA